MLSSDICFLTATELASLIRVKELSAIISIAEPGSIIAQPLERDFSGARIAWSSDLGVLQLAHAFEQATGFWKRRPPVFG